MRGGAPAWMREGAMVRSGTPGGAEEQQSLGDLVALAAKDISQLIRYEISLAKSELRMDAQRIGLAAALVAITMFVLCLVIVLLSFAAAFGFVAAGVPISWAFVIVAAIWVVFGILACLIAYLKVRKVTGMKMTRKSIQDNLEMLRRSDADSDGAVQAAKTSESLRAGAAAEIPARQ
jgi:uncharacterized membrane protein YqjE